MVHVEIIPHHSNDEAAATHAIANIAIESEENQGYQESIFHIRMFTNFAMMD
jgi:hypothetical protein